MDGVSAAAGIIAVLQLTSAVLKFCYSMKGRTPEIKDITQRLESLKAVLYRLNDLETRCPSSALPCLSDLYAGPLPSCCRVIEELQTRLQRALGSSGIRGLGKRITWPEEKKEIYALLARIEQDKMMFILALSSDHAQQGIDIKHAVSAVDERIAAGRLSTRHGEILRWLNSGLDPSKAQYNAWKKHQPSTGDWFICGEHYTKWKARGKQSLLWLYGIPGCGKTVLLSTIVTDLTLETQSHEDIALAYFYYDFNEEDEKRSHSAMLRSMLGQLACQSKILSPAVEKLYSTCSSGSRLPRLQELCNAFLELVAGFSQVYIVVDALDESTEENEFPAVLIDASNVHVLAASRHHDDIAEALKCFEPVEILANARIDDIRVHVKARLENDPRLAKLDCDSKELIETTLVNSSDGMFRWVECQLEALRKCRTPDSLIKSLGSLPKTLDETYERILSGIDDSDRDLAIVAFEWLAFSARPLRLDELADALAVRPSSAEMDKLFTPQDILTICSSLVTLTPTGELKLAHFTVKEYLLSDRILQTSVSAYAIHESQASKCIVERSVAYLCHLGHRECENNIASTYIALRKSPHTLKEFNADENLCAMFSSRSSVPKPRMRNFRTDMISRELRKIAMDQEYRLFGYAATYWQSHLEKISASDFLM